MWVPFHTPIEQQLGDFMLLLGNFRPVLGTSALWLRESRPPPANIGPNIVYLNPSVNVVLPLPQCREVLLHDNREDPLGRIVLGHPGCLVSIHGRHAEV